MRLLTIVSLIFVASTALARDGATIPCSPATQLTKKSQADCWGHSAVQAKKATKKSKAATFADELCTLVKESGSLGSSTCTNVTPISLQTGQVIGAVTKISGKSVLIRLEGASDEAQLVFNTDKLRTIKLCVHSTVREACLLPNGDVQISTDSAELKAHRDLIRESTNPSVK